MKIVSVFKSSRKDEMYLYVDKREQLERVPEALQEMFGKAVHVMDMPLKAERKLARIENTQKLLDDIEEKGFYLQLPPQKEEYMLDLFRDRPETGVR
ncbi:YcgL domain-containing protein [Marinobacterium weihaiense]|uniref:YcgL domain-containing protein KTN04_06180 n=1 Tax=Marinobacterium weihaiense TaxID=2851016 RepID=A0ABS6M9G6_9GAMM|nr:YcgL domain-containing protein [Marinobacterium weihaiense]MBV0932922.1 YcgL domain-containing protein [Marinobacterium weihaiense]